MPGSMELNFAKMDNAFASGDLDSPHATSTETSPTTSSFSNISHHMSSSVSSCSSSPSVGEPTETFGTFRNKLSGLPDLVEEPMETLEKQEEPVRTSYDWGRWSQDVQSMRSSFGLPSPTQFDGFDGYFARNESKLERKPKRQRSADFGKLADRVVSRLPSISRRSRMSKSASLPVSEASSAAPSPKLGRSRSNSRTRPLFKRPGTGDGETAESESQAPVLIETITEDEDQDDRKPELALPAASAQLDASTEPLQRATTPLLPTIAAEAEMPEKSASTLPSPRTVVPDAATLNAPSPLSLSQGSRLNSPLISGRPSLPALTTAPADPVYNLDDSPILLSLEEDEWSRKLGHADFQIHPEPYLPECFDRQNCDLLLSAWQKARAEFSMHLARTTTHFGQSSTTYQLSEEKWAEIDAKWRDFYKRTIAETSKNGDVSPVEIAREPAPVTKIPLMNDPRSEGKFPKLGDLDIVGPMEQVESPLQIERRASKKAQFLKLLDGIFSPTVRQTRATSG
ncbi:MAG: hypothetical protein M1828_004205 [Chrysothrix sp. TS-e1954]|nr:MAG: hypothetical protein M1828_004205 [Chrysothrix sp. TS-e1954]